MISTFPEKTMICPNNLSFSLPEDKELYWHVILSDGSEIYEDDRPDNAWLRLKEYVYRNNLKIDKFNIRFRSHNEDIGPDGADGYFFVRGVWAFLNGGPTFHQYVTGVLIGDEVHIKKWKTPELIIEEEEKRPVEKCEECLIRNRR